VNRRTGRAQILALLLFVSAMSACGFHLQGAVTIPRDMERTYIETVDRHSLFYRELRLQLKAAGVQLVDSSADATAIFSILVDDTDQRVLSVSARNVPTEYEVYYSVRYSLTGEERRLLESQFVTLTRDYTYDETLVLGKALEEDQMRNAIVADLVRIVLRQIASL